MIAEKSSNGIVRESLVRKIGLPTIIIAAFYAAILIAALMLDLSMPILLSDMLRRFGMNGLLVLAMVPSIQSGTGPNFALPIGIVCGLFAIVCGIELGLTGFGILLFAFALSVLLAVAAGYFYGRLLNAVKGAEMTIATYTGFSVVALMSLVWLMAPFANKKMGWLMGSGLRETIQLDAVGASAIINDLWSFVVLGVKIPTGLLLVFFIFCFLLWLFTKTKTGLAVLAGGISPKFAKASGLDIDRNRIIANIISTVLAAVGIILFSQSYGYVQLYSAPLMMAFPAVAAILVGGATASRAKVSNAIIGVFLFQGLLTTSMPVANELFAGTDLSEIMRMIIQNGIILYALTQVKGSMKT
jgi:simple sugar transport system permease protein